METFSKRLNIVYDVKRQQNYLRHFSFVCHQKLNKEAFAKRHDEEKEKAYVKLFSVFFSPITLKFHKSFRN